MIKVTGNRAAEYEAGNGSRKVQFRSQNKVWRCEMSRGPRKTIEDKIREKEELI